MSIDALTVRRIAHLARIRLDEAEVAPLAIELNNILNWVEELAQVDTSGIEPMTGVVEAKSVLRADKIDDGGYADRILANAPQAEFGFFGVPKVIE